MKRWRRALLLVVLVAALCWTLVAYGTVDDVPSNSIRLQETTAFVTDPEANLGERVVVDGNVGGTNPLLVQFDSEGERTVTVTEADAGRVAPGSHVYVFGELIGPSTVRAERVVVVKPWERRYTFFASAAGGLLVFGRFLIQWRIDLKEVGFTPRYSCGRKHR
jgi:hypothetical protein